jgi:glyoxylase I family protein
LQHRLSDHHWAEEVTSLALHHLAIATPDPDRLAAFYQDVLGLELHSRHEDAHGTRAIWLELSGPALLMLERSESRAAAAQGAFVEKRPGFHLLALAISAGARSEWRTRLEHSGVAIVDESLHTIYFRDPDGNRLGLSHHPAAGRP